MAKRKSSKKSFGYFTHGSESTVVQAGVIGLVLGSIVLLMIAVNQFTIGG